MTDVSSQLPRYDDLLSPTLNAISELGGSGTNEEITNAVVVALAFSDRQLDAVYPTSGAAIIPDRIAWARSYLKIAGLLDSVKRGVWAITETGRQAIAWPEQKLRKTVADAYNKRAKGYGRNKAAVEIEETDGPLPDEAWADQLLAILRTISPDGFERLCQRLLRAAGFTKVEVTGRPNDGGIDGIGVLRVQLVSFQVFFQCKRYKGSVGSGAIRDFRGAMAGRADKGLVLTIGTFTAEAKREATRDGAPAIDLVDGEYLCQLLKEHRLGVTVEQVEAVTIDADLLHSI